MEEATKEDKKAILNIIADSFDYDKPYLLCGFIDFIIYRYMINHGIYKEKKGFQKLNYVRRFFPEPFDIINKEGDKMRKGYIKTFWILYEDLFDEDKEKAADLRRKVITKILKLREKL